MRLLFLLGGAGFAVFLLNGLGLPFPKAIGTVGVALFFLAVATGLGLAVTLAVAAALVQLRSGAALQRLRDFGEVRFQPEHDWSTEYRPMRHRLRWKLNEAALREYLFSPLVARWSLVAGLATIAALLLLVEVLLLTAPVWTPFSVPPARMALILPGIAALAAALVLGQGRRSLRSRQEAACAAVIQAMPARWEKFVAAAVPHLQALQKLSQEFIAVGESAGWPIITEVWRTHRNDVFLESGTDEDKIVYVDYMAATARYFNNAAGRWRRDDAAALRSAVQAVRRELRQGMAAFPDAAACFWEALAAGYEAELALKSQNYKNLLENGFQRYSSLIKRLFSKSVHTMLEGIACGEDPAEYKRTVTAIREEAEALIAEAEECRMNTTEAYIVLGLTPAAERAQVEQVYRSLLELWRPLEPGDGVAVRRTDQVQRAYAFLQEQGRV